MPCQIMWNKNNFKKRDAQPILKWIWSSYQDTCDNHGLWPSVTDCSVEETYAYTSNNKTRDCNWCHNRGANKWPGNNQVYHLPSSYTSIQSSSLMALSVPQYIYIQLDNPSFSIAEKRLGERTWFRIPALPFNNHLGNYLTSEKFPYP